MDAPDILLILPDQWRGDCLGHLGHPLAVTPYIDQLAERGTSFRRAYSPATTCVPARACLATGLDPWRCGRLGYQDGRPWPYRHTLMHRLRDAGYHTAGVGKTHFHPMRLHLGFEQLRAYEASVREPGYDSDYHRWLRRETGDRVRDPALERDPNAIPVETWGHEERLHPTRWTADQALEVLATRDPTRPLFMQVGFHRPHVPFDPPERHYRLLRERPLPPVPVGDWVVDDGRERTAAKTQRGRLRSAELDAIRYAYHAQLAFIDEQVGRLLRWIEQRGRETWIIVSSDHGEMLGDHHRMFKGCFYEGSARVPLVVCPPRSWQGARGRVRDEPVDLRDLLPTCCGIAGIDVEPAVDGRDLGPLLGDDGEAPWRELLHGEHHGGECWQMLTDGRHKYLWESRAGRQQLFDLEADPQECHDLAADPAHAALVATWRQRLIDHLAPRACGLVRDGDLVAGHGLPPSRDELLAAAAAGEVDIG